MIDTHCDWGESVHGKVEELFPDDAPETLGKHALIIRYHGANLHHNIILAD